MAFTFYSPPTLSAAQSGGFGDVLQDAIKKYGMLTQAQYLQPNLVEELQKARLANKYFGPEKEALMRLQGAQTGHLGAMTQGQNITNKYLPQSLLADIEGKKALASKRKITMDLMAKILSGQNPVQENEIKNNPVSEQISKQYQEARGMPLYENQVDNQQFHPQQNSGMQQPNMNLGQASLIMQTLGMGKPHFTEVNGKQVAITPFGAIDTGVQGQTALQKALSAQDAKKISDLETTVLNSDQKIETFNNLNTILGSNEFEQLRQHPLLGKHELSWYSKNGTPEQQRIIGEAQTYMGNIIKDSARDFAGQFRVGEQALLNNMKPNVSDSLETMKGKSEALTYLVTMASKRAEMEANLMRERGLSALQARKETDKFVDPVKIKTEIQIKLHPKEAAIQAIKELEKRRGYR